MVLFKEKKTKTKILLKQKHNVELWFTMNVKENKTFIKVQRKSFNFC